MGEQKQWDVLDNTNSNNPTPPQENQEPEAPNEEQEQEEQQLTEVEYQQLDSQLDALFTALDDIESKNDNIHAQLLQLLDANKEIRKQLKAVEDQSTSADAESLDKSDTNQNN